MQVNVTDVIDQLADHIRQVGVKVCIVVRVGQSFVRVQALLRHLPDVLHRLLPADVALGAPRARARVDLTQQVIHSLFHLSLHVPGLIRLCQPLVQLLHILLHAVPCPIQQDRILPPLVQRLKRRTLVQQLLLHLLVVRRVHPHQLRLVPLGLPVQPLGHLGVVGLRCLSGCFDPLGPQLCLLGALVALQCLYARLIGSLLGRQRCLLLCAQRRPGLVQLRSRLVRPGLPRRRFQIRIHQLLPGQRRRGVQVVAVGVMVLYLTGLVHAQRIADVVCGCCLRVKDRRPVIGHLHHSGVKVAGHVLSHQLQVHPAKRVFAHVGPTVRAVGTVAVLTHQVSVLGAVLPDLKRSVFQPVAYRRIVVPQRGILNSRFLQYAPRNICQGLQRFLRAGTVPADLAERPLQLTGQLALAVPAAVLVNELAGRFLHGLLLH